VTRFPSTVQGTGPGWLADAFPTILPDPEKLVYEYLHDAVGAPGPDGQPQHRITFPEGGAVPLTLPLEFDQPPELGFYQDRPGPAIPVVRGWPAYPGKIPTIGVASGNEGEDQQQESEAAGFAGDVYALDANGQVVGSASYFAEALYIPVIVQLLHENRDERDRLHRQLRRVLVPLRRKLPGRDPQIKKVKVEAEKAEVSGGPPEVDQPFLVYLSVFTVHVWCEMLEATDVTGADGVIGSITVTTTPI
jgi:hypothetical protein